MIEILTTYVVPIVHVLACLFLIVVVLLQTGKGADMGAVFGGGSQTLFGSSGAGNFLTKLTTGMALAFMVTSLIMAAGEAEQPTSGILDRLPAASVPLDLPPVGVPEAPAAGDGAAASDAAPAADAPTATDTAAATPQAPVAAPAAPEAADGPDAAPVEAAPLNADTATAPSADAPAPVPSAPPTP
jgi:preprotein translocase subunit SecG